MSDEVISEDTINSNDSLEEITVLKPQTRLNRFTSKSKENILMFSSKAYSRFEPIIIPLKNRYVRYTISSISLSLVVVLYILYESPDIVQNQSLRIALVPIGLVIALFSVLYVTWDDSKLGRYRTPGLYVIALTAIFYVFIYTPISDLLFATILATWMTKSTGFLTASIVNLFGIKIEMTIQAVFSAGLS